MLALLFLFLPFFAALAFGWTVGFWVLVGELVLFILALAS